MAEDLATVRTRIRGVQQLNTVIAAMRGIAAAHAQQSRTLLPGFRAYSEVIAHAIASALRVRDGTPSSPDRGPGCVRIVFCAEQGFVGGFAERILDEAVGRGTADLLLVGSKGVYLAAARKIAVTWQSPMATQIEGVAPLCIRITSALLEAIVAMHVSMVEAVYPVWEPGEGLRVVSQSLLPLDEARFRAPGGAMPPLMTLPPEVLLANLAEEYVYASLCEAAVSAFVAENEARAAAMVRARSRIDDILDELHRSEHRVRQESITAELIELLGSGLAPH